MIYFPPIMTPVQPVQDIHFQSLELSELTKCSSVCKAWHQALPNLLATYIKYKQSYSSEDVAILQTKLLRYKPGFFTSLKTIFSKVLNFPNTVALMAPHFDPTRGVHISLGPLNQKKPETDSLIRHQVPVNSLTFSIQAEKVSYQTHTLNLRPLTQLKKLQLTKPYRMPISTIEVPDTLQTMLLAGNINSIHFLGGQVQNLTLRSSESFDDIPHLASLVNLHLFCCRSERAMDLREATRMFRLLITTEELITVPVRPPRNLRELEVKSSTNQFLTQQFERISIENTNLQKLTLKNQLLTRPLTPLDTLKEITLEWCELQIIADFRLYCVLKKIRIIGPNWLNQLLLPPSITDCTLEGASLDYLDFTTLPSGILHLTLKNCTLGKLNLAHLTKLQTLELDNSICLNPILFPPHLREK